MGNDEEAATLGLFLFDGFRDDLHRIDMPQYSTATPRILGYNRIGELIDEDVQGVTLSCDESLGTTSGNTFMASGNVSDGILMASLDGMTATVPVRIIAAIPAITLHPILIDNREYPVEVTATVNANTYFYDPSTLHWDIGDDDVATGQG